MLKKQNENLGDTKNDFLKMRSVHIKNTTGKDVDNA